MHTKSSKWRAKIEKALRYLKNWQTPVAQYTFKTIEKNKIPILPFSKFSKAVLKDIKPGSLNIPATYFPSSATVAEIAKEYEAVFKDNKIYISNELNNSEKIARILIHEVRHYLNQANYGTKKEIYHEELSAHIASALTSAKPITRSFVKTTAQEISKNYNVPIPKKIQFPNESFYPIPKELR